MYIYKLYLSNAINSAVPSLCRSDPLFAPIPMHLQNFLRAVVSVPKHSTYESSSWLDLTHITPQLIVAAGPTDNIITGLYRSPIQEVVSYLETCRRRNPLANWHIWNFRAEGSGYAIDSANWTYRPFPDHEPPSVVFLIQIVNEIAGFLLVSPGNIALIHCKEGKGRSGTVCCAYLMHEAKCHGVTMTTEEAIGAFTRKRMRKHFGRGISILSQIRYLDYYTQFLQLNEKATEDFWAFHSVHQVPFSESRSYIDKVIIYGSRPFLTMSSLKLSAYMEECDGLAMVTLQEQSLAYMIPTRRLEVDVGILLGHSIKDVRISFGKQLCYAYSWFNLFFETRKFLKLPRGRGADNGKQKSMVTLSWSDFDGIYGLPTSSSMKMFDKIEVLWVLQS